MSHRPAGSSVTQVVCLQLCLAAIAALLLGAGHAAAGAVPLVGHHPNELVQLGALRRAASYRRLNMAVFLTLRNRGQLDKLLIAQQDPSSPRYHRWLTPAEFTARFVRQSSDYRSIADWLSAKGFRIASLDPSARYIRFNGTVAQAERTFGVTIVSTSDDLLYTNLEDPHVPARFAGLIAHLEGLDNLRHFTRLIRKHRDRRREAMLRSALSPLALVSFVTGSVGMPGRGLQPEVNVNGLPPAFGPSDIQDFYDETPLLNRGIDGGKGPDCIAVIEDSNFAQAAVDLFDSTFSMPAAVIKTVFPTTDPGLNGDESETLLDLEYAHATAPDAPLTAYIGNQSDAAIDPITDGIQKAVSDNTCSAISVSFSNCGAPPSFFTGTIDPLFAQAASQGQSVFVSSGDVGAAGLVVGRDGACVAGENRGVNEVAADPNVTAVGGTEFDANFDNNGNDVGFVSERVWNEGLQIGASGGGVSAIFPKPAYQKGVTPADSHRDLPDVSLIASADLPGVFLADDSSDPGSACTSGPCIECCDGGTSLSTPLWAGISRVFAQIQGGRLGNLNPLIYHRAGLAKAGGLRDVTIGNNDFNGVAGFSAQAGYDLASGWGTLDVARLADALPTITPKPTPTPTGTLELSAKVVAFPATGTGTTATTSFNITNSGAGLLIGHLDLSGLPPSFSLSPGTATDFSLSNAQVAKVVIQFAPATPGSNSGNVVITTNDPKHSLSKVAVTGKAVPGILTGNKTLSFGAVKVNTTKTIALTIKDTGLGVLNGSVDASGLVSPFVPVSGTGGFQLRSGQSSSVVVQFTPTAKGAYRGKISITSDGGNLTVAVTGTGI